MTKKKFIIIDGNALVHRAFHALPPLTTKKGKVVNAVYGFSTILLRVLKEIKPEYVAVTFDTPKPTFRHKEFKEYKAQRKKQPQELYDQIPIIQKLVQAFNLRVFTKDGFEADDVIGTIVTDKAVDRADLESIIVTGDLDTLQLVDANTKVYTLRKGVSDTIIYSEDLVKQKYGLKPDQLIDYKALRGDPSDNITGVPGIGEKTAINLIKEFKTLDNLYQEIKDKSKKSEKIKERIIDLLIKHKKDAYASKKLVTIVTNTPLKFNLTDCKIKPINRDQVVELFQDLEFKSLLARIPGAGEQTKLTLFDTKSKEEKKEFVKEKDVKYQLIDTEKDFQELVKKLEQQNMLTVDTETTDLDPYFAKLLGISLCFKEKEAYYINVAPAERKNWLQKLKPILEEDKIKKNCHHFKFDLSILKKSGINLQPASFDTMIASYLLNPGSRAHKLDTAVFNELGHEMIPITNLIGSGRNQTSMEEVPLDKLSYYSCEDADYTHRLMNKLAPELKKKSLNKLFDQIEMPLIPVLERMEDYGVKINPNFLKKKSQEFDKRIKTLENKIHKLAGIKFNVSSPIQLKEVLFEKLKISTDKIKKIKTGISTAASELEKLRGEHPIIDLISEYREFTKLKTTYLDALPKLINKKTGRVHTSFNQTFTEYPH